MKLVRFARPGYSAPHYGVLEGEEIAVIVASPFDDMRVTTSERFLLNNIKVLAPCQPTKVVAVGLNYRDHAHELGMPIPQEPLIFLKPPSSVIGPEEPIICPDMSNQVEYEAELAVVIRKRAFKVDTAKAFDYILGFTCLNDVTARDLQKKDVQFTRSKSFDTFCPIGPVIETELDPSYLEVRSYVNGEKRQDSNTNLLIHKVPELLSFISDIMTLEPGDVIATGTPYGVGQIRPGDEVAVEIEGIGILVNPVR